MGFQSGINNILGEVGHIAKTAAVVQEVKEKNKEQGMLAKEQYYEASADLKNLKAEQIAAQSALDEATTKAEATKNWNMTGKNKSLLEAKAKKRLTEKEAAKRAFDELTDRIEAKKAMQSRAEAIMKRTGTWGGMR